MKVLDVGCGGMPQGDVNIDLYPEASDHRRQRHGFIEKIDYDLRTEFIPNFKLVDVNVKIPFKDNSFEIVYSAHVIEHIENPVYFLKELIRVSSCKIIVKCPYWFTDDKNNKLHLHKFNKTWFAVTLAKLGIRYYRIDVTNWKCIPHEFLPLIRFPLELTVTAYKC